MGKNQKSSHAPEGTEGAERDCCGNENMQVCLKVDGDEMPTVVLIDGNAKAHPANLVPLDGVSIDRNYEYDEDDAWAICDQIAELCRSGACRAGNDDMDEVREHLTYAYSILFDYLREAEGDYMISKATAETLIRCAIDRIVRAGKCVGFKLDEYRSED